MYSDLSVPKDTLDLPCDVILAVEGGKLFKARKQVLSVASPFFEKLLNSDMKESKEGIVRLEMFSEPVMRSALEFLLTGHVQILTEDNARDLIVVADYLLVQNLKTLAEGVLIKLIPQLDVSSCFLNYHFSERYQCEKLFSWTKQFILANFNAVYSANRTEILNMSIGEIEMLISSDEINVSAEEEVFNLILSWIAHDKSKRQKYFDKLFCHARLVYVSRDFLCSDVVTNDLVAGSKGCLDLVENAMKLIDTKDFSNLFVKPRNSLETSIIVNRIGCRMYCYIPREDKWCPLGVSQNDARCGIVSCRDKLYSYRESALRSFDDLESASNSPWIWHFKRQLFRYDPYSDKWMSLPYTGNKYRHVVQLFVTNQDELYAWLSEPCERHELCPRGDTIWWMTDVRRTFSRWDQFCGKEEHVFFITKYNQESNSWEDISSFSFGRCHVFIVATDNFIYFIGGKDLEWQSSYMPKFLTKTDVDRYDIKNDHWSKVADIHEAVIYDWMVYTGAALNENVFIFGVETSKLALQCQMYDETTNAWQVIASPNGGVLPEINLRAVNVDGKLYAVIRNYYGKHNKYRRLTVECYDPDQDKWSVKTDQKVFRYTDSYQSYAIFTMRIYEAFLADHQQERLNSFPFPSTPSASSGKRKRKCLIM